MLDQQSAARAERQTVDVRALIGAARRTVDGAGRSRRRIPNRPRAHDARRRDVLVEERRRHLQHAGHVVEAIGFVVLGKEGAGVDAQREQFLDRVGVLGAIQPMERHASRIRVRRGGLVERALQPRHEPVRRRPGPAGACLAEASCRRAASARLSPRRPHAPDSCARSIVSNVRLAVLARWLWHVTQYWSRSARSGDFAAAAGAAVVPAHAAARRRGQRRTRERRRERQTNRRCELASLSVDRRWLNDPSDSTPPSSRTCSHMLR